MNFHCYVGKQKYLDNMFMSLYHPFLGEGELPLVLMGSAKISATIKGTRPAPTVEIQNRIKYFVNIIYTPEPRTSIICSDCGALTKKCCSHGPNGYPVEIRGMQFCPGRQCRLYQIQLKNRDENGAKNIVIRALFRPDIFNTGDKMNLTDRRRLKYINHGNKDTEKVNRKLGLEANALRGRVDAYPL